MVVNTEVLTHIFFIVYTESSHEIKTLVPWKKSYDLKSRHHFAGKGLYSQSYGFSSSHIRMWALDHEEGWVPKNQCFRTMVLERVLRVPWTARGLNQSILKEINPQYSLKALMLKLKFQYFGHLMWRANSLEQTLQQGKIESRRGRQEELVGWHYQLNGHESGQTPGDSERQEAWCTAVNGVTKSRIQLSDWTTTNGCQLWILSSPDRHTTIKIQM